MEGMSMTVLLAAFLAVSSGFVEAGGLYYYSGRVVTSGNFTVICDLIVIGTGDFTLEVFWDYFAMISFFFLLICI